MFLMKIIFALAVELIQINRHYISRYTPLEFRSKMST